MPANLKTNRAEKVSGRKKLTFAEKSVTMNGEYRPERKRQMENRHLKSYSLKEIPNYKIHGRTDETKYPLPVFFNGGGIEVSVTGKELWIDIESVYKVHEMWIAYEINGELIGRQMLPYGRTKICLFRNMSPDTVKNVYLFRELQAMTEERDHQLVIWGMESDGEFLPVEEKAYKLEFVGDSITSGEGTYGAQTEEDWISMFKSCSHSFPYLVSKEMHAEFRAISQSGWGVLTGWDNNPDHNVPSRYEKICGFEEGKTAGESGADKPYDFSEWIPDAVIINLGTNDASAFKEPMWRDSYSGRTFKQHKNADGSYMRKDVLRLEKAMTDFLTMVRKDNPTAHILWAYGMIGHELSPIIKEAVENYKKESKDLNVSFLELPDTSEEQMGSLQHPGKKSHECATRVIAGYLKKQLSC